MLERIKSFAVGLSVGAGVGAVIAILLTPDSGENLRHKTRAHYQQALLESARMAELRRQQLREELNTLTTPEK